MMSRMRYRYIYGGMRLLYRLLFRTRLGYHLEKLISGQYVNKLITALLIFGVGYVVGSLMTWAFGVCYERESTPVIPYFGHLDAGDSETPEAQQDSLRRQKETHSPSPDREYKDKLPNPPHNNKYLVILILSSPNGEEQRNAIRSTWLKTTDQNNIVHVFAIGTSKLPSSKITSLEAENRTHNDLLLLPSVQDSYYSLTYKLLMSIKWVSKHFTFDFLLKVDDDSFVRLDALIYELQKIKHKTRIYMGFFDGRAQIKRSGKWAENRWFLCDRYLPHALGGGYVLSHDLVHFVDSNSHLLSLYNSEDVSVGTWLAPLHINRIHDPRFDTEYQSRGCINSYIVTHKQEVNQMKEKYYNLKHSNKLCTTEYKLHNSYIYNWKVLPSKCCPRGNTSIP